MALSRRFLNLIVDSGTIHGAKSLCCIDLNLRRNRLFDFDTATPPARNTFKKIQLPSTSFTVRASDSDLSDQRIHFFSAAADRRVFCLDQSGRALLLEADTPRIVMLPRLYKPKIDPISLYVPYTEPDFDDLDGGGGGNLFILDRRVAIAKPEPESVAVAGGGFQFEALVYRNPNFSQFMSKTWSRELVPPPPPYVHGDAGGHSCLEISSYAVVKAGSQICVSVDGIGTYSLDAASETGTHWIGRDATYCDDDAWSEVGKWTLPFRGEAHYAPELKLWFGFTANDDQNLAAADLSDMDFDSQPYVLDSWKELETPKGWQQVQEPQLVCLGYRRFCIARFFRTGNGMDDDCEDVTVLTGVEVIRGVNIYPGKVGQLGMVKHKSLCHKSGCGEDTITAVF